jgi:hypothetical protein
LYKKRDALSLLNPSLSRSRRIDVNKRSKRRLCLVELDQAKFVLWCVIWEIILRDFAARPPVRG